MAWNSLGESAAVLIGAKPSVSIEANWAQWMMDSLNITNPDIASRFAIIPYPSTKEGSPSSYAFLVNKEKFISVVNNNPDLFKPVASFEQATQETMPYLSTEEGIGDKEVRTGVLLGYPKEDAYSFAQFGKQYAETIKPLWMPNGEGLKNLGFSEQEIETFLTFRKAQTQNIEGVNPQEQYRLTNELQPKVAEMLNRIPDLDEGVKHFFLNRKNYSVKGIHWVGAGPSQERDRFIEHTQRAFKESGMDDLLKQYGKGL